MELAGIDAAARDPDGGEIVRGPDGAPIGVFRETASGLLRPAFDAAVPLDPYRQAALAAEEALSKGITSFQDAGVGFGTVDLYRELADAGDLGVRLYVAIRAGNEEMGEKLSDYRMIGYGDDHLTVRGIKKSMDGALGPHGAWLLEPYSDLPTSTGLNTTPPDVIEGAAELALEHDYQLWIHAIGDRANQETLNIFEAAYTRTRTTTPASGPWESSLPCREFMPHPMVRGSSPGWEPSVPRRGPTSGRSSWVPAPW
jgi:predicted amidohydrolase YtcJ